MAAVRPARPAVNVLLVEDSPNDAELMVEALNEGQLALNITVVVDGELAIDYLRRRGSYHAAPRPDLILLDLHLPRKNGHEVLSDIKQDESLRLIPVVLLTSSDSEEAFREAYDRHVNCCVRKPSDLDQFTLAVKRIESFWLQLARLVREP
jgi:chemotaxis family two-component system response regulator Rcp1